MWVQASGPPDRKVVLFDYTSSRAQEVPLRLLESYRGYVMTDDYAGYNALALQPVWSDWRAWPMRGASSSTRKSAAQGQDRTCRYRADDDQQAVRHRARAQGRAMNSVYRSSGKSLPILAQLKSWLEKTQPK
jgi:hypothetical protein